MMFHLILKQENVIIRRNRNTEYKMSNEDEK